MTKQEWISEHTREIAGFRLRAPAQLNTVDQGLIEFTPEDFFFGDLKEPLTVYGKDIKVHVPRSLCNRAGIVVKKEGGEIVAKKSYATRNL